MSASLVGSEMCIRDRGNTCRASNPSPVALPEAGAAKPRCGLTMMQPSTCLLYTSDAADDM
eukprot:13291621-Alexandrium_andersonii.AAC.1